MKPFHHRDPNAAGAVLASNQVVAELICDEAHLHPATVRLAVRAMGADRILLVSDATSVVGSAEGNGILGSLAIRSHGGAARLEDGRMAGSILTMVDAVRNLIEICKLDISTAVRSATMVPASLLGIADRVGSIAVGKYADLLVLDPSDFRVLQTYVGGERIFRSPY
jgi:N-acetylglucosamine-6-phosphate deacetylase